MNIYRGLEQLPVFKNGVLTIGTFDGVHKGHRAIISRMKAIAKEKEGETILLTFHPHPRQIIQPTDESLKLLTTLEEKINILREAGIDNLVIVPFSRDFSNYSAEEYITEFLVKNFHPHTIIIGYDHRFGKDRRGDITLLQAMSDQYGYKVEEIPPHQVDNLTVSSTKIRLALSEGDIVKANDLLGYLYRLHGKVVHGDKIGRTLGFPTANLLVQDTAKLIPKIGIYAVKVWHDGREYTGMMYIGNRPTLNDSKISIEVNILYFSGDLYGETLEVWFYEYIRDDKKFDSLEQLSQQLDRDKLQVIEYFG